MQLNSKRTDDREYTYYLDKHGNEIYHGEFIYYSAITGEVIDIINFEHGIKNGEYRRWNENGQLIVRTYFRDGNCHGEYNWWYSNGVLGEQMFYVDGAPSGACKWWSRWGTICNHLFYCNGRKHGEAKEYSGDGIRVINHTFFIDGVPCQGENLDAQEKILFQIKYPGFRFIED